ncbi:aspartyl protease [Galdieria sulphuraria]|uniref:Aspartyl protease n=1 Tax=Galdieria sulphuraria TaxID=130081 RepID=M2Y1V5_GALSU|nr:aspartyl protease [Galdieria sulphuraria]EME29794.1 aspartyl protease [Galdieria sulphuraria]|eukprot:XP_005706314.1 aspartyl protease [Galdieria sulphuraria]
MLDKSSVLYINKERKPSFIRNRDGSQALSLPLHPRVSTKVENFIFDSQTRSTKFDLRDLFRQLNTSPTLKSADIELGSNERYFEEYLHGSYTFGEYYVEVGIGENATVYLQLDTGSSNLIVNTNNCSDCNDAPSITVSSFSQVSCSSSSCSSNFCAPSPYTQACGFYIQYGSGLAEGALLKGDVEIANITAQDIVFGGILKESKDFEPTKVSGILGMAYNSLACQPTCVNTLFDELYEQEIIKHRIFTVLLNPSNGVLVLGGAGNFETNESNGVPILQENGEYTYYIVGLKSISVGAEKVWNSSSEEKAIVDTGTTLLYVTSDMFSQLVSFFESYSSTNREYWSKLKSNPSTNTYFPENSSYISSLPNISFSLSNDVTLEVSSSQYILCSNKGCAFAIGVGPSSFPNIIFGDMLLQNYYVIFDQESNVLVFGPSVAVSSLNLSNMPGVGDISLSSGSSGSSTIPTYGIVLIVVAAIAVAGVVGIGVALIVRRKRRQRILESPQYAAGVYGMRI